VVLGQTIAATKPEQDIAQGNVELVIAITSGLLGRGNHRAVDVLVLLELAIDLDLVVLVGQDEIWRGTQ
jgi:hypothetical protein